MKIVIDYDVCEGHGQCEYVAPEIFSLDEEGWPVVSDGVPESLREKADLAVSVCPTQAIRVED